MRIGPFKVQLPKLGGVTHAVKETASEVGNVAKATVDGFEHVANRISAQGVGDFLFGGSDAKNDGMLVGADGKALPPGTPLSDVPAMLPAGGVRNNDTIIQVNGVSTTLARQVNDLREVADATGSRVIGLHNATNGFVGDAAQEVGDEFRLGDDKASDSLAQVTERELLAGRNVHILAHSQGGVVTARALEQTKADLTKKVGAEQAAKLMGNVQVETFGGAAWSYPDGPKYTHYVNLLDIVPEAFGQGVAHDVGLSHPGAGAKIINFAEPKNFHSLSTYLSHRIPA